MAKRRRKSVAGRAVHELLAALGRMMSVPEVRSAARSTFGARTTRVTAESRRKQVAAAQRKQAAAAKKAVRKIQPSTTGKAVVAKRNKRGQWDGSKAMAPHELAAYRRQVAKAETPPPAIRWTGTRR